MSSIFLDKFSSVSPHGSDGVTLDIQVCPMRAHFLTVSPSCVSVFVAEGPDRVLNSVFALDSTKFNESGAFIQSTWLSPSSFSVLTSLGSLYSFSLSKNSQISLKSIKKSKSSSISTCIQAFQGFIILGNDMGSVSIISSDSDNYISRHLIESSIKKLSIRGNSGLIVTSDARAFSFTISNEAIVSPTFDFKLKELPPHRAVSASVSPNGRYGAVYDTSGQVYITDFSSSIDTFKTKPSSSASLTWTQELVLLVIFREGSCFIWTPLSKIPRHMHCPDLSSCTVAEVSHSHLLASCDDGIYSVPIITCARTLAPIMYGPDFLIEMRPTSQGAVVIPLLLPSEVVADCKQIEYVAADPYERLISVAGHSSIFMVHRSNGAWFRPEQPKICARGLAWMGKTLCALNFKPDTLSYSVIFLKPTPPSSIEAVGEFDLPHCPIGIQAEDDICSVLTPDSAFIFHGVRKPVKIALPCAPALSWPHRKGTFVLLQNQQLVKIDDSGSLSIISEGVSNFLLDSTFALLFVSKGLKISIVSIDSMRITPFIETSDVPIGIFGSSSTLLSLPSASQAPFKPNLNHFFDFSIVSEMSNPDRAASSLRSMEKSPGFPNMIRQISISALREKMGRNCVKFLLNFPDQLKSCLSSSLRAVESPERQGVFQELGPPSKIFCDFAGLRKSVRDGVASFEVEKKVQLTDLNSAALLLPVIMEEEGPLVGFPASIYVLSQVHDSIDYVESLLRFLDPIISPPEYSQSGTVNCSGMQLSERDYSFLKNSLNSSVASAILDLFEKVLPQTILPFAEAAQLRLSAFLKSHKEKDKEFDLLSLLDKLATLVTNDQFSKKECKLLRKETIAGEWEVWTAALMLVGGESEAANSYLSVHPTLKRKFIGSQWQHLIDT